MELTELISDFLPNYWLLGSIGILSALYIYLTWNFGFWEKQGVKCDKPWPVIGTMGVFYKKTVDEVDSFLYKKYGRIYGMYEGRKPLLMVADPELMKTILLKDFNVFRNRRYFELKDEVLRYSITLLRDDEWKNLRNTITPTFTTGKIKQMTNLMFECAEALITHLKKYEEKDEAFDSCRCFSSYTMDVIATCAFGTKINSLEDPNNDFVVNAKKAFTQPIKLVIIAFLFPALAKYLPLIPQDAVQYFKNLVNSVISRRKEETQPRKDFLQLLLEAKSEGEKEINEDGTENRQNDKGKTNFEMTHNHVVAQAIIFFLAGYETTAATLSLVLYNLILNEEIQDKLIKEVDDVLQKHNGSLSYDAINEMQYMDMVISETLRLFPPGIRLERECQEDYTLNGIVLKKGCVIGIPIYSIHHDEEFYPDPEVFDPERFSTENRNERNPYIYLPFGYGLRNCIGMRFALIEMKVALACIFKTFRVKKCEQTKIPFKRDTRNTFLQPESMYLKLDLRKNNST